MTFVNPLPIFLAAANPVEHAVNQPFWVTPGGWWVWSAHMGNLVVSALILIPLMLWVARSIAPGPESMGADRYLPRNKFAHTIEVICIYLRDQAVKPLLGARTDRFMPFLWTVFFFILINNLLGLVPIADLLHLIDGLLGGHYVSGLFGGTATQNIWVTGALALVAAVVINIAGVRSLGIIEYMKHMTAGTPWYLWGIMVPIEVLGVIIKPAALAIRLFANMTAGHILLAVLFMFVGMSLRSGLLVGVPVTLVSGIGGIAIMFLELFVAFLQAFVFMFLTTVFVSLLSPHAHDEHHEHPEYPPHHDADERILHGTAVAAH